ncbi:CMRF35-like molecule 5 isoform X1 [Hoplias malabaricus]|uniref:CMRF35-like molecule 5 isoform X1 n=1 Tax=Hoplias malabaricus TaxID=27720 RepID=UPI0034623FD0
MEILQLVVCIYLLALRSKSSRAETTGYEGGSVQVKCSHTWAKTNRKYFCRDPCKTEKDVIVDSNMKSTGRFHLMDTGTGDFTVDISQLNKTDSGKYWCGVDRLFGDTYNEAILTVLDAPWTSTQPRPTTSFPTTVSSVEDISTSFVTTGGFAALSETASVSSNGVKTSWKTFITVSVCVLLLVSVVWILAFLALHYKACSRPFSESSMKSQSYSRRTEFEVNVYKEDPSRVQDSVSQSHPPESIESSTNSEYENIFDATTKFPVVEKIYTNT